MYRLGRVSKHHYWILASLVLLVAGASWAGVIEVHRALQPHTVLTRSKPYIGTVADPSSQLRYETKRSFRVGIPMSWEVAPPPNVPYTVYSWRGTGADAPRRLDLYIDTIPASLAVNRLLPVTPDGDRLSIAGEVSDNCVRFTARTSASAATGAEPAKWSGVSFLCDVSNYERDVVGTGSPAGVNSATVTGSATGEHKVFFVYTDNSASPDYTIFEDVIKSFQAL